MKKLLPTALILLNLININCDGGGSGSNTPGNNEPVIDKLSKPYNVKASQGEYSDKIVITWDDDNNSENVSWYSIYSLDTSSGDYTIHYYNLTCDVNKKTCEFEVENWIDRYFRKYYFKVMAEPFNYDISSSDLSESAGGYINADDQKLIHVINYSESKVTTVGRPTSRPSAFPYHMVQPTDPGEIEYDDLLYRDYKAGDPEYLYYDEYTFTLSDDLSHSTVRSFPVDYGEVIYILWETVDGVVQLTTTVDSYQWYFDNIYDLMQK
jgi:hypothetical protein